MMYPRAFMTASSPDLSRPTSGDFVVGPGMFVTLHYEVRDSDGEPVGGDEERISIVFGMGSLLPVVERAIDGRREGDHCSLQIEARDAYGHRDPRKRVEFDRSEFPSDAVAGDHFEVENAEGEILVVRILEVEDDMVLVDLNHPLAGQDLKVEVQILTVRPATRDETELAVAVAMQVPEEGSPQLIAPDRLLSPHRQR
jgi:FKBP-type peptidyl-prolyl cis-trans isomerase 2